MSVGSSNPTDPGFYEFDVFRPSSVGKTVSYHGICEPQMTSSFSYLFSSKSGEYLNGENTYVCDSTDFYPDDSYSALSASRDQVCLFGLRLVPPLPNQYGAAFWTMKQQVAYGFETSFKFQVIQRSKLCPLLVSPNVAKWCYERGGRGFAFVVQNEGSPGSGGVGDNIGYKISSVGTTSLGYSFSRNLAIEIDYFFDPISNDPSWNHIAVMVPVVTRPSEDDNLNSADHATNTLAIAEGVALPPLNEGLHTVTISYDVFDPDKWESLLNDWYSAPRTTEQTEMLTYWSFNRPGRLSVSLDGENVLTTLVDIAKVVQTDPVTTFTDPPPSSVNTAYPGSAWVGFVGSTGPDSFGSPVIVDWTFKKKNLCAQVNSIVCQIGSDSIAPVPRFTLRNIGTVDVKVLARTQQDPYGKTCGDSTLRWNEIHPYFLGCESTVRVGFDLAGITISDPLGVRSVEITDPVIVNRDYVSGVFVRRDLFSYCVIEHESDPYRLSFAQCDCSFCNRVFNNQFLYAVFYSTLCSQRYTFSCTCFEVSQVGSDTYFTDFQTKANPWKVISQPGYSFSAKTMQMQLHSVCNGCKFDGQCSLMNPSGTCKTPSTIYHVGNPLKPEIGGSFESWSRGATDPDGVIKGSSCDCGDSLVEPLFLGTSGNPQLFDIYLKAYLQGTESNCLKCLRLPGSNCLSICGSPVGVSYLHYPAGQSCATCTFSSSSLFDLTTNQFFNLRKCVYAAIEVGNDPWTSCVSTVNEWLKTSVSIAQTALVNYLNGVATHFLAECPGTEFTEAGAVCTPNLFANPLIPIQALARGPAEASADGIYFPVWWDGVACLNARCEVQDRTKCYKKLYKIIFRQDSISGNVECADLLGSGIGCHTVNSPTWNATDSAAVFQRSLNQFAYTDPLDRTSWSSDPSLGGMTEKSLEVWASVSPLDGVSDLAQAHASGISASSSWGNEYEPRLAVDGDFQTFWQSKTSISKTFTAKWEINFGNDLKNAQGYRIFWTYYAVNFIVEGSTDGGTTWSLIDSVSGNSQSVYESPTFFVFSRFRITMTLASSQTRPVGQDQGLHAFGIAEVQILDDLTVSRLKPVNVVQTRAYPASFAVDGDYSTWWSTPPGEVSSSFASLSVGIPEEISDIALARVVFRKGFVPVSFSMSVSLDGGSNFVQIFCFSVGCDTAVGAQTYLNSYSLMTQFPPTSNGIISISVEKPAAYFDSQIVQISEIEVFSALVPSSTTLFFPSACVLVQRVPCPGSWINGQGTVPPGVTVYLTNWVVSGGGTDDETLGIFRIEFSSIPESITVFSPAELVIVPVTAVTDPVLEFAVVVNDIADLSLAFTAKSGSPAIITSVSLKPLRKLDLSGGNPTGSSEWIETIPTNSLVSQGVVSNINDGDSSTEFRTQLGAPSLTSQLSIDPDYVIQLSFPTAIPVDMVFIDFSFASQWFRLEQTIDAMGNTGITCEWVPDLITNKLTSTSAGCLNAVIAANNGDYYRFNMYPDSYQPLGSLYFAGLNLVMMQSSAVDLIQAQTILGVREVQIFSAFPILPFASIQANGVQTSALLTDSNFATFQTFSQGETIIVGDLNSMTWVKQIEIWFAGDPIALNLIDLYLSFTSQACASTEFVKRTAPAATESGNNGILYSGRNERIRCVKIVLRSPQTISVSEIIARAPEASFKASVVSSTLEFPARALDGDSTSLSNALPSNAINNGLEHYILMNLPVTEPVFGVQIIVVPGTVMLDSLNGISLFLCRNSNDNFAACVSSGHYINVPLIQAIRYMFAPFPCSRVAVVFTASSASSSGNAAANPMFSVSDISVFQGPNLALAATATFNDPRAWIYHVNKANDGKLTVPWISESDVTESVMHFSLIQREIGAPTSPLDPSYIPTNSPSHVSSLKVDFLWPVDACEISYSIDGNNWNSLESLSASSSPYIPISTVLISDRFVFANYIRLSLEKRSFDARVDAVDQLQWESPIFGVSELTVMTRSRLELGKSVSSDSTADSSTYVPMGAKPWIALPPSATAEFTIPTSDVSGVVLNWIFAPLQYSVSLLSFGVWISISDFISTQGLDITVTGAASVSSIKIEIANFAKHNNVFMSALSSISVLTPADAIQPPIPLAPALDDSPAYMVDGDPDSVYTSPDPGGVHIDVVFPLTATIGKVQIEWGNPNAPVQSFSLTATLQDGTSHTVFSTNTNSAQVSVVFVYLSITSLIISTTSPHPVSIQEISFWGANGVSITSGSVVGGSQISFDPISAIDEDIYSMWMADPSGSLPTSLTIDLASVYPVKQVSILWGWRPVAIDILVSLDGSSFTSVSSEFSFSATSGTDTSAESQLLEFRFLKISLLNAYVDSQLDPSGAICGGSIRDVVIEIDQNLARSNGNLVIANSGDWWDFPPFLTGDGISSTYWLSQRGLSSAFLQANLGIVYDIAGVQLVFEKYIAGTIQFYSSMDCVSFTLISTVNANAANIVTLSGQQFAFQAQCVKTVLSNPLTLIPSPDNPTAFPSEAIFGVSSFSVMRHVGGGGLFGIEARVNGVWGSVFDSIAFAPFQPAQWVMLSNQQARTEAVNGPASFDDITNLVQVVATFTQSQVTLYRNGVPFGTAYTASNIAWDMVQDVRLVLGVRSSAFVGASESQVNQLMGSALPGKQDSTLSPFFQGQIKSATLFSRALLAEEVEGLFLTGTQGKRERGCLCYDSCPTGSNYHYPTVSVPCSGQGVCLRQYDSVNGLPIQGVCKCSPGFSGANCATHCSQNGGCCSVDDDCPLSSHCDASTNSCLSSPPVR